MSMQVTVRSAAPDEAVSWLLEPFLQGAPRRGMGEKVPILGRVWEHEHVVVKALSIVLGHADPTVTLRVYTHELEDSGIHLAGQVDAFIVESRKAASAPKPPPSQEVIGDAS